MCIRDRIYHDEPISRDGIRVGYTTSASYGHALGASVGMGYVTCNDAVTKDWIESGAWTIEVASEACPATAQLASFYDPKGARMRG